MATINLVKRSELTQGLTNAQIDQNSTNVETFINNIIAGVSGYEATKFKIGFFTRDTSIASETQAITGVGFTPKEIEFIVSVSATSEISTGFDDGTNSYCVANYNTVGAGTWRPDTSFSIQLVQGAGVSLAGRISTMDDDGFTINWTKTGSKTGTAQIIYKARR